MKLKSLILTICLSLFALSGLLAQDKYEYANLIANGNFEIAFVTEGEGVKVEFDKKTQNRTKVILTELNKRAAEGWEVIGVTENPINGYPIFESYLKYHLRKKKNQ